MTDLSIAEQRRDHALLDARRDLTRVEREISERIFGMTGALREPGMTSPLKNQRAEILSRMARLSAFAGDELVATFASEFADS